MPPGGPQVRRELRPPLAAGRVPGREGDRGPRDLTIASRRGIDLAVPDTEAATGTDWEAMPLSLAAAAGAHPPAGCRGDGGGDGDGGGEEDEGWDAAGLSHIEASLLPNV